MSESYTLIVLGGVIENRSLLGWLAAGAERVIAADGAAELAMKNRLHLDCIVGDLDSVSQEAIEYYRRGGTEIHHIPDQYSNDFEKALHHAFTDGAKRIRVVGISGGRTDHALTNMAVMCRFTKHFESFTAYDDTTEMFMLTSNRRSHSFDNDLGTIISLVPMPIAHSVATEGLLYPIAQRSMVFGDDDGLSNQIASTPASVSIEDGALLVCIQRGGKHE